MKNKKIFNLTIIILIIIICSIIFYYQTQKKGLHEDEGYTIASSVNPDNGLMVAYPDNSIPDEGKPEWKTKDFVINYMSLSKDNYLNLKSVYVNQAFDNHPPFFYAMVHFATIIFGGRFSMYSVFIVNIIGFVLSCYIIKKILNTLNKENLIIPILIFYGLSMGTISMVLYQRTYMLLTFFILLYFYYSIKIYQNKFTLDKKMIIKLGIATVLGFLTQYFFAIYAFLICIIMLIKMIKNRTEKKVVFKYVLIHLIYAVIGILLFLPSIAHLLYSDRGISNLGNSEYFKHFIVYLKHLAFAFSLKDNLILISTAAIAFIAGIIYLYKKDDKFVITLTSIPSIVYLFIVVKLTSFQELRYIMPMFPFISILLFLILDAVKIKYKNVILIAISIILVTIGIITSEPRFLYKNYKEILDIANENQEKSFIYIYDNFFNHMQSVPEMMIYSKTLILNYNKGELDYLVNDENLVNEDKVILSIKSYMDNDNIIKEITDKTNFKNVEQIYKAGTGNSQNLVENNIYLLSK